MERERERERERTRNRHFVLVRREKLLGMLITWEKMTCTSTLWSGRLQWQRDSANVELERMQSGTNARGVLNERT